MSLFTNQQALNNKDNGMQNKTSELAIDAKQQIEMLAKLLRQSLQACDQVLAAENKHVLNH